MRYGLSDAVTADLQGVFRQFPDIAEVRIFGSRAKGNYNEGSDIDLAITGDTIISFDEMLDMRILIEDLGLLYKVDLVDYLKCADSPIGRHIDRIGQTFYKRDLTAVCPSACLIRHQREKRDS